MPYLVFLGVCLTWSISFILMKKAALAFSPASIAMWRVIGGAAILGLIWLWRDRKWSLTRRDILPVAIVILAGCAWPYSIQPWVISRQGSAFMALMCSFVPLLTILLSVVLTRTLPAKRQLFGVLGALICMGVLLGDGVRRNIPWEHILAALSVPACYAVANTTIRMRLSHAAALLVTLVSFAGTGVTLAPLAGTMSSPTSVEPGVWWQAVAALAFLGFVGTGIATFGFNWLIRRHGPLFAGMTTNLVPLGAILLGWIDGERVNSWQLGAIAGIVAMVTLVQYGAAKKEG